MITFGGVALPVPDSKLAVWVEQTIPLRNLFAAYKFYGRSNWGYANTHDLPAMKLNTLYWPTNTGRFACGVFLADKETVNQLGTVLGGQDAAFADPTHLNFRMGDLRADPEAGLIIDVRLFCLQPVPFVVNGSNDWAFLLPLVDERFWQTDANQMFDFWDNFIRRWPQNKRQPEPVPWISIISGVTAGSNPLVSSDIETIEDTLLQADLSLFSQPDFRDYGMTGRYIWNYLDSIAYNLGWRSVCYFDRSYALQPWQAADTVHQTNLSQFRRTAGYDAWDLIPTTAGLTLPRQIVFRFPEIDGVTGWFTGKYRRRVAAIDFEDAVGQGVDPPREWIITDTCKAVIDPDAEEDDENEGCVNLEELQVLADTLGTIIYNWASREINVSFAGICNVEPCGYYDTIEFHYRRDQCYTRVRSYPPNWVCFQMNHQTPNAPAPLDTYQEVRLLEDWGGGAQSGMALLDDRLEVIDSRRTSQEIFVVSPFGELAEDDEVGVLWGKDIFDDTETDLDKKFGSWRVIVAGC